MHSTLDPSFPTGDDAPDVETESAAALRYGGHEHGLRWCDSAPSSLLMSANTARITKGSKSVSLPFRWNITIGQSSLG